MISHNFFNFSPFFLLKISLVEMLIAVGNEHLKSLICINFIHQLCFKQELFPNCLVFFTHFCQKWNWRGMEALTSNVFFNQKEKNTFAPIKYPNQRMFFSDLKIAFHTKISCWCHKTTLQFESIIINCIYSKPAIALAFPCSFQIFFHRFVHQYYINAQTYLIFVTFITPAYFDVWKMCV